MHICSRHLLFLFIQLSDCVIRSSIVFFVVALVLFCRSLNHSHDGSSLSYLTSGEKIHH